MIGTYLALLVFALTTVALALYRRPTSEDDFLIRERQVGALETAAATFTLLGGGEFVTLTALTYFYGLWSFVYFVGIVVGFVTMASLAGVIRGGATGRDLHSLPDFFALHFGPFLAAVATVLLTIALGALLQIQFVVGSQILATLTDTSPIPWVIAIAAIVGMYLCVAGFRGVLATDMIQAAVMFVAVAVVAGAVAFRAPSPSDVAAAPTGALPVADALALVVLGMLAVWGGGDVWQRVFAARSDRELRTGLFINAAAWLVFGLILVWLAFGIRSALPGANPSTAFVDFVTSSLSPALGPLVGLLILSAIMSTADVELFVIAILLNKELTRRSSDRASRRAAQWAVAGVAGVSAVLALFARDLMDVYFLILFLLAVTGPVAFARALGRGNRHTALLGLIGGSLVLISLLAYNKMAGWYQLLLLLPAVPAFLVAAPRSKEPVS
jgi:SSS family solute:Na+ symporter